jgi:hypothetical protein
VNESIPCGVTAWNEIFFIGRNDGNIFEAGHVYMLDWTADAEI